MIKIYDQYIENADNLGAFKADIFKRWRNYLLKYGDQKETEAKEIFKIFDDKKRGNIEAEALLRNK